MKHSLEEAEPASTTPQRWQKRCWALFLIGTLIVVAGMLVWSMITSMPILSEKAATFAATMRIVRPVTLLMMLALWQPVFNWLLSRSFVSSSTAQKAIAIWPRLAVWTGLLELTIGQGFIVIGIIAIAVYWIFLRERLES